MKMTLKEFKELVGKDKEMNEGFMDFFRKKSSEKDQPKEYPVEKYKKLYSKLQGLQRAVQLNSNEKKLIDLIGDKLERYDEAQKGNLEPDNKKRMMQTQLVEIKTSYLPDLFKSLSKNHPEDFKHYFGSGDVDSNLNEGFMDFFRKKDKPVETPEVESVEDVKRYMRLYRELFTFAKDVNVGKKDLAFLEQIKRELNRIKFSPINKKSSITSNAVQKIRTQYLPMLLQSLMNNHNKEFNRYVDKDFINSFEIKVPTVRYSSSDVSPKELYFVADEMLKFAVKQDYKDVYIRKLNSLLQKAKEFKNLYEKSPDDFGAYYQEFNSLVIELKKMLTTWRNKFNVNYNMLPTGVKYFALNEQSFKKSRYNMSEELKVASDGGYYNAPDRSIIVSKETADFINKTIEEFKSNIKDENGSIIVDKTEKGQINLKIIKDLKKNWGINFEYDTEGGGVSFYWLSPNQNMDNLNDGLEYAWQLFYDKIKKDFPLNK